MPILRSNKGMVEPLKEAIKASMALKPEKHHFDLHEKPQILRFMNATGG
jgi:cyclic pyranopterin phosphate synthase